MSGIVKAIKELREKTGAGMMDCRRAIEASDGDMEKATVILEEQGLLQLQERQDRETNEGRIFLEANDRKAVLLRLACETDFVARNANFIKLGEECLSLTFGGSAGEEELSSRIREVAGRMKENIVLRRLTTLAANQDERMFSYVHGEGRIAAAVSLSVSDLSIWEHPEVQKLASDLTLHVAAFGPLFLSKDSVDSDYLRQKEAEFLADTRALGKPESILEKIVRGKIHKHLSQVCLLEQGFIHEETSTVGEVIDRLRNSGLGVQVRDFLYDCVGD